MKPEALLFDLGGTLDTDGRHWSAMFRKAFCLSGVSVPDEEFSRAFVEGEKDCAHGRIRHSDGLFATLLQQARAQASHLCEGCSPERAQMVRASAVPAARWCMREVGTTLSEVRPMLIGLHDSYRLGIVSNFYGNLAAVCDELGLLPLFDCLIDSDCVGCRKPDTGIFRIAVEALGREPREVVMIGDSYSRDIVPAKRIGCRTVWLKGETWETIAAHDDADRIIGSVLELPPVLEGME